jgi:hypothetical protein
MHKVIPLELRQRCVVNFVDDLVVHSLTREQHTKDLEEVMACLEKAGLKLKPSKCFFYRKSVRFLGHIITHDGVHMAQHEKKDAAV